jgi:hypothetical protein
MKRIYSLAIAASALLFIASSCEKDDPPPPPVDETGKIDLYWEQLWGSNLEEFSLNKTLIHTKTGDTMTFTTFKFYISNIRLKKADGSWWAQENSYYLVDQSKTESRTITIDKIPPGDYTEIEIMLGIDSLHNTQGAQSGALSPANGMFWDWTTAGYIFLKAEGNSPQSSSGTYAYHLGGYYGANKIITVRNFPFPNGAIKLDKNKKPVVHMLSNPARLWHNAGSVALGSTIHEPGPKAVVMATDFYGWINLKEIR